MKYFRILLVFLFISFTGASYAQQMIIGTYNIRFDNKRDSGNLWADRAPIVAALLRFHDFDIFGTQEALKNQLDDISNALPAYSRYGLGRDDGGEKGEHAAIFFKKAKYRLLNKGDFWLSQTPEKPSLGWDATCCNRICTWVQLQDIKNGKKFYVFNAHFDHQGVQARKESSKLILSKINALAGNHPVVFMGDLNGDHESEWYRTIAHSDRLKDSYFQVKDPYVNSSSFNGFGTAKNGKEIIDHVFVSSAFKVEKWGLLTDTYNGKFPSDHFPVYVRLTLK